MTIDPARSTSRPTFTMEPRELDLSFHVVYVSESGEAEAWQAESGDHPETLRDIVTTCKDQGWFATLYDAFKQQRGTVDDEGGWSLS